MRLPILLLLALPLCAQYQSREPTPPFNFISGEGAFDSTIRDQVNTNTWLAEIAAPLSVPAFGPCSNVQDCSNAAQNAINTLGTLSGLNYGGTVQFPAGMGNLTCVVQPTWGNATTGEISVGHGTTPGNCVPPPPYTSSLYVADASTSSGSIFGNLVVYGTITGASSLSIGTIASTGAITAGGNITANNTSTAATARHWTDTSQVHDFVVAAPTFSSGINQTIYTPTAMLAAQYALGLVTGSDGLTLANIPVLRVPLALTNPTFACGSGAGSGTPTCVCTTLLNCTNNSGSFTVTPNGTTSATATVATITFSGSFYPNMCTFSPSSLNAGGTSSGGVGVVISPVNAGVVTFTSGTTVLNNADVFTWTYVCI